MSIEPILARVVGALAELLFGLAGLIRNASRRMRAQAHKMRNNPDRNKE